jgi:hypothetical protein
MGSYPEGDAARLLRAIDAEQAHGRAGSFVLPYASARSAGLRPGTERYEEALWALVWGEALEVDSFASLELAAMVPFGRMPYRLGPKAARLLETA